jgi:hypothetical protein
MGAWGNASCSTDHCWDNLFAKDIHAMTQQEANHSVDKFFAKKIDKDWDGDLEAQLGVVVWVLRQGLNVNKKHLVRAKEIAKSLLGKKEYLDNWKSKVQRVANLKKEIKEISKAIKNKGQGNKQHVPGLMEKIIKTAEPALAKTSEVVVVTFVFQGVIEDTKVYTKELVEEANKYFAECVRKASKDISDEDIEGYVDDGYFSDDNHYEVVLRWTDLIG